MSTYEDMRRVPMQQYIADEVAEHEQTKAELAEARELMCAVLDAIDVPAPAYVDREQHRDLVVSRARDVRTGLRGFLNGGAPFEATVDWVRQTTRDYPVRYRTEDGAQ